MSVPVHGISNAVTDASAQPTALPNVIMSTPKINTIITTIAPPAPLPDLQFLHLDTAKASEQTRSGLIFESFNFSFLVANSDVFHQGLEIMKY